MSFTFDLGKLLRTIAKIAAVVGSTIGAILAGLEASKGE
jgi:hypothetical protein